MLMAMPHSLSGPPCPVCEAPCSRSLMTVQARHYWRCAVCVATFLDPAQRLSSRAERDYYLTHRNDPADAGYRRFLARLADPLLQRLPADSTGLDFGCGPGPALAAMLREAGHTMAVYDPYFFPDEQVLAAQYDFITCTEVIEHLHRPAQVFRQLGTLLRPGGWLALMTRIQTDDARFAQWHYRRDPTHIVFYREATLRHVAARLGWDCEIRCPDVALWRKPPQMLR